MLWERYPSIRDDLLLPRQQDDGSGAEHVRRDDDRGEGAGVATAAAGSEKRAGQKGTSFWMALDDFTAEFSQARGRRWSPLD